MTLTTVEKQEIALRVIMHFAQNGEMKLPTSNNGITEFAESCDVETKKMAIFITEIEKERFKCKESRHNRKMAKISSYFGI